ncbi:hypothetical protein B7486_60855, partial [cyanobacterium TDX16]
SRKQALVDCKSLSHWNQIMIATEYNFDNFSQVLDRLDEFGLTPNQFRIYCHLFKNAVNGVVSESSESIAKTCKLTRITVIRVVSDLSKMNLISCDRVAGKKTVFHLMPCSDWRQPVSEQKQPIAKVQTKVVLLRVSEGRDLAFRQGHRTQSNSDTCKPALQVNEIYTQQGEQKYPYGVLLLSLPTNSSTKLTCQLLIQHDWTKS